MYDSSNVSVIIFALLAVFVIWKLRSVLGARTGHERPPFDPFDSANRTPPPPPPPPAPPTGAADQGRVVRLPGGVPIETPPGTAASREPLPDRWRGYAEPGSRNWIGLDAITAADPSFDVKSFLTGAASAYEMIVLAFAAGDRATLQNLLSPEVYESFDGAIRDQESRDEKKDTTIVSVEPGAVDDAQLKDGVAQISVRFVSKLITATRDKAGAIVDGSPDKVVDHVDIWTFARPVAARDPNWKLVSTQSAS